MVSILALPEITVVQCLSIASPLFVAVKRQELVLQNKTLLLISDVSMLPWFSTNLFSDVWKRACKGHMELELPFLTNTAYCSRALGET